MGCTDELCRGLGQRADGFLTRVFSRAAFTDSGTSFLEKKRFMLPIWSFNLIVIADMMYTNIRNSTRNWLVYVILIKVWAVFELGSQYF